MLEIRVFSLFIAMEKSKSHLIKNFCLLSEIISWKNSPVLHNCKPVNHKWKVLIQTDALV